MTRYPRTVLASLYALYSLFVLSAPVGAQTSIDPTTPVSDVVDFRLLAIVPVLIVALSAALTRVGASPSVKQTVPAVVTAMVVAGYYAQQVWPDSFAIVVGHAFVALTLAGKIYDVVDSIAEKTAGKRLTELTGPGLIG